MLSAFGFGSKPSKPPKAKPTTESSSSAQADEREVKTKPGSAQAQAVVDIATTASIESMALRSVKISIPKGVGVTRSIEDDIYRAASMFGTIMDIRIKGKNAVVLYSQVSEAQRCTSSWADTNLAAQDYRIKSFGSAALDRSVDMTEQSLEVVSVTSLSGSASNVSLNLRGTPSPGAAIHEDGADILTEGIAFDGSVMEHNRTLQVLEMNDLSQFYNDRTAQSIKNNISIDRSLSADKAASPGSASRNTGNRGVKDTSYISASDSYDAGTTKESPSGGGVWKLAEKPKTPPARPARAATPPAPATSSVTSNADEGETTRGYTHDMYDTYISSAHNTSGVSEDMSAYSANYQGDRSYNNTTTEGNRFGSASPAAELIPPKPSKSPKPQPGQQSSSASPATAKEKEDSLSVQASGDSDNDRDPPKPVFGNILEVPSLAIDSSTARSVLNSATQINTSNDNVMRRSEERRDACRDDLLQRIRMLEAEARVSARERADFDDEIKRTEENWAIELTALGIRNKTLELDNNELREDNRRAKIELAKLVSEIAAMEANDSTRELSRGYSKNQAERDAFGTLLAQQQLVKVLNSHKDASEAQVKILKVEIASISAAHKSSMVECQNWKVRATAAEEELAVLRKASEDSDVEHDKSGPESKVTATERQESSSRRVLNQEMERYLSLERSLATPVLAHCALDSVWKYTARESQFSAYFDIATESSAMAEEKLVQQQTAPPHPTRYSTAIPQHWRNK